MTSEHSVEKFTPDLESVLTLASLGFGRPVDGAMRTAAEHMVQDCKDVSYRIREGDRDVAQLLCQVYQLPKGQRMLWIQSAMVLPDRQGQGLTDLLSKQALADTGCEYVGLLTQSPAMYAATQKMADVYPKLDETPMPPDVLEIYKTLYPSGDFPIRHGEYGGASLYATPPDHSNAAEFYGLRDFHPEQGDAVACIGRVHEQLGAS